MKRERVCRTDCAWEGAQSSKGPLDSDREGGTTEAFRWDGSGCRPACADSCVASDLLRVPTPAPTPGKNLLNHRRPQSGNQRPGERVRLFCRVIPRDPGLKAGYPCLSWYTHAEAGSAPFTPRELNKMSALPPQVRHPGSPAFKTRWVGVPTVLQGIPFLFIKGPLDGMLRLDWEDSRDLTGSHSCGPPRMGKLWRPVPLGFPSCDRGDGRSGAAWTHCSWRCRKVIRMSGSLTRTRVNWCQMKPVMGFLSLNIWLNLKRLSSALQHQTEMFSGWSR